MREPTIEELERELLVRSLAEFVKAGWNVLHPEGGLLWSWHMDVLCAELEAQHGGDLIRENPKTGERVVSVPRTCRNPLTETEIPWTQDVVFNVPPGTSKSMLTSVFLPAWMWLRRPGWRAIFGSANPNVALRDSLFCRNLMESDWYQKLKPGWAFAPDQNAKGFYLNNRGGFRMSLSVGAKITGTRADALFVDDPLDANQITETELLAAINWWDKAFGNRLASPEFGTRTIIMQRLHEIDLSGHVLEGKTARHVVLPMEHDPALPFYYAGDPRRHPGLCEKLGLDPHLLHPKRFPPAVLVSERKRLRETGYAGQMQQHPVPAAGNKFQRAWWRFWRPDGVPGLKRPEGCKTPEDSPSAVLPADFRFDEVTISVDANFKESEKADPVVVSAVGRKGPNRYLLDRFREPCGFGKTKAAIKNARTKYPRARRILIELKANGDAIVEDLKAEITGVIGIDPEGGKEARAAVMEPVVESGNWWLPEHAPWLDELVSEFALFPKGKHDDQVDSLSQLECDWTTESGIEFARRMGKMTATA
jgi:predicted phage terminase large subunit-like protein